VGCPNAFVIALYCVIGKDKEATKDCNCMGIIIFCSPVAAVMVNCGRNINISSVTPSAQHKDR